MRVDVGDAGRGQLAQRRPERHRRTCELEHFAPQAVDPLDRVGALRREDLRLDLLDVLEHAVDHRLVRVDDPVDDGVERGAWAQREELRLLLEVLAHVAETAGLAVADRDQEVGPDEDHHLADVDQLLRPEVADGLDHEEQRLVVDLQLRPLMGADGVLDGELVELELAPDGVELD